MMAQATNDAVTLLKGEQVNMPANDLINAAVALGEGELAANGALVVKTGARTGRSPKDRFIVKDATTEATVDWGNVNQPISREHFNALWQKGLEFLCKKGLSFTSYLRVGAHATLGLSVKVNTELAWHQLFANDLFIRPNTYAIPDTIDWEILSVPGLQADPEKDGTHGDAAVILNFTDKKVFICGTQYAGEMKKAMFSVLNYLLPEQGILPMHCAANAGDDNSTALFFGLSGTGKTTLSADPNRHLIGDDEHGWGDDGIFNFEGGCYAKCIDLSEEREPMIWRAIKRGAVLENVVIDSASKTPDYTNVSLTQNTRAAYPRDFIPGCVPTNNGKIPNAVLFLTCDLYGVLPPVAKLTPEQAAYYFLSGYTALVGSTEVGQGSGIKPTFSTCFGAPFFPRPPRVYAELLIKRLEKDKATVYLVNTGWSGGAHGQGGKRFSIPTTRAIVTAIVNGDLASVKYETLPGFNLQIPTKAPGVDVTLLDPRKTWKDQSAYDSHAKTLMQQFVDNFKRFDVSNAIKAAGPSF